MVHRVWIVRDGEQAAIMFVFDNSPGDIKAGLIEKLADQAHWRRRVAQRFPDDPRNLRGAELCDDLAVRFRASRLLK